MRNSLLIATVLLGLVMTPCFANVQEAYSSQIPSDPATSPRREVTFADVTRSFEDVWSSVRNILSSTATAGYRDLGVVSSIQEASAVGDSPSNSTDPLQAAFGNGYNQTSNFTFNFVGRVLDIRKQLLNVQLMQFSDSETYLNALLALVVAFIVSMLMFCLSSILTLIQGFVARKKIQPHVSYGQQFVTTMYMIPYTAYYTMLALMLAVVIVVCLVIAQEVEHIANDTGLITKLNLLAHSISTLIAGIGNMIGTYINEKMPTSDQIQELGYQISRTANATMALAIAIENGDKSLNLLPT